MQVVVSILIDDVVQVSHRWSAVPREGDMIILSPAPHLRVVSVGDVVWRHSHEGDCAVDLNCFYVEEPTDD